MQKKVAVVILNYNGKNYLSSFLPSVVRHSPQAEIVVADNASTDDSVSYVAEHFPNVRLIRIPENKGFCGGYNTALRQIEATYYVLLNSDVEVTEGWLEPMLAWMDTHAEVAACQPKVRAYHEKSFFEFAGAAGGFIDWLGYPFCRGRIFDVTERDEGQYDMPISVFWATGACLMIRASLYHEVGGLDEAFFAHFEEIDLCWRLKTRGFQIVCCPQSVVYHVGGGTLQKMNPRKTFFNFRNSLFLLAKNLPSRYLFPVIFLRLCLDGVAGLRFLLKGQPTHCWAIVRAHGSFYAHICYLKQQRQKKTVFSFDFPEVYRKTIVIQHFLFNKKRFSDLNFPMNLSKNTKKNSLQQNYCSSFLDN